MADGLSEIVASHADVRALVRFAPTSVNYFQEEQRSGGKEHAMGARVVPIRFHPLAIFVPLHRGRGASLGLAVERSGFALGYDQVGGVLHDAGRVVVLPQTRSWRTQKGDGDGVQPKDDYTGKSEGKVTEILMAGFSMTFRGQC